LKVLLSKIKGGRSTPYPSLGETLTVCTCNSAPEVN
jgi:hypothetical protein